MNDEETTSHTTDLQVLSKQGDRLTVEGLSQEEFHQRARVLQEAAKEQGIELGAVYHAPLLLGMIFVK